MENKFKRGKEAKWMDGGWWNAVCKVQAIGKWLQNFAAELVQANYF